jgi:hypothetical protein
MMQRDAINFELRHPNLWREPLSSIVVVLVIVVVLDL